MAEIEGHSDIKLSILLPTVKGREDKFERLKAKLDSQAMSTATQILSLCDNKEISVGTKRQLLLQQAQGEYIVFVDDDDDVPDYYVSELLNAIQYRPDCIGFLIQCTTDGKDQRSAIASKQFDKWADNQHGFDYVRTTYHKTPVRRDIALQVGFKDLRFAEDADYSERLKQSGLLKFEWFIGKVMYYYQYSTQEHPYQKYGIIR